MKSRTSVLLSVLLPDEIRSNKICNSNPIRKSNIFESHDKPLQANTKEIGNAKYNMKIGNPIIYFMIKYFHRF